MTATHGIDEVIDELLNYLVPREVIPIFAARKRSGRCECDQPEKAVAGRLHFHISLRGVLNRVLTINKVHGAF